MQVFKSRKENILDCLNEVCQASTMNAEQTVKDSGSDPAFKSAPALSLEKSKILNHFSSGAMFCQTAK